ncbi:MAG: hypothetical protein CVU30_08590 [Betaproteobacteria bacterium HGW-Betaproteobacteria-3]|nr:MAG: hypothetical protein CVU30_08590 [Betaproteobacteria bacterium HGW-Betaproteobacteria-3]
MNFNTLRRKTAGFALLIFLCSLALPMVAAVQRAIDPIAYAGICSTGVEGIGNATQKSDPDSFHVGVAGHDHCLACPGATPPAPQQAAPNPTPQLAPARLEIPSSADIPFTSDLLALLPLAPRAPPRV